MQLRFVMSLYFLLAHMLCAHAATQTWVLPTFSSLEVTGTINLELHTGYQQPSVILSGDKMALENVQVNVVNGILYLALKKPSLACGPVTVDIRTARITSIVYHGKGSITGRHLRTYLQRVVIDNAGSTVLSGATVALRSIDVSGGGNVQIAGVVSRRLFVKMSGRSKLRLTGIAALRQLDMEGQSWFSLSWVKSTALCVHLHDKAYAEIAGIANKMDAETWDHAQLNARFLRARRAFVKTHDYSVAEIAVTQHQHTLALDASDIRYYNLPTMKTDFLAGDGAVLDMRHFDTPFVEEVTPYNR